MAVIKPKGKKAVIQAGTSFTYNPKTFIDEHYMPNFYETDNGDDVFNYVKPVEYMGRKFLFMDTEDYALKIKNNALPKNIVRRWVGTGKKGIPVDIPFCITIGDGKNYITLYDDLPNKYIEFQKLRVWLEDPTIEKVFHNAKFDMHMLANVGFKIAGKIHDTVVLAKLVNENRFSFDLWSIAEKKPWGEVRFEYMVDGYKKANKVESYKLIPRQLMTYYANADVQNCYNLFMEEFPILVAEELEPLYDNELKLMMALWFMERIGMRTNKEYEAPLKQELQVIVDQAEREVYDAVGYVFNMNSSPQIQKALVHMGVDKDIFKYTDKGNVKLDKKELERLILVHEVELLIKIQEYRKNEKLLGTYAVGIYDQVDAEDRAHGSINQTEATTGRMSITKPALQTLPKKDKRIRRVFIPSDGYKMAFMDLDQVEYRGFAHYAQALGLIDAIKRGWDVHQATAALIFGVHYDDVTEDQRSKAKTINFGLLYGQGEDLTAASLKMKKPEARRFRDRYFASIPEAQPFINTVMKVTTVRGYVKNYYGRRRRLTANEAYKAVNALIQGWAADYIKHKLVLIFAFLMAHNYKTRCINIVHDELVEEIHEDEMFLVPKLRWLLSDFDTFRVPITAGVDFGNPSWGDKVPPEQDIPFEPLTEEEMKLTLEYDFFDGSVFDKVLV